MSSNPERWLVTGGAGFIGSHFVDLAASQGSSILVLDALTYAGRRENLESALASGRVELVVGDICDRERVASLLVNFRPTALFHFAAESHVDRSIEGPLAFVRTNIEGTAALLCETRAYWESLPPAERDSFRYVQISTDEVFGALGPEGAFREDSPFQPNSPYSASKASADLLVRAWHRTYGFPAITTHCSNNYGPRQFPEKLIPLMIRHALEDKPLPVYGKGQNVRDWIHVLDHCEGVRLAWEKGKLGERYCLGGGAERTNLELVQTLCKHLDELAPRKDGSPHASRIRYVEDRLGHDWRYAIDDAVARKELGFHPKHSFETGLRDTVVSEIAQWKAGK